MKKGAKGRRFSEKLQFVTALKNGTVIVWLSGIVFGLGCLLRKQFIKGMLFLLAEIAIINYMLKSGCQNLGKLLTLGELEQQKIWDDVNCVYTYVDGDRSLVILLYGIVTVAILFFALVLSLKSIKCAYALECIKKEGKKIPTFREELKSLFDTNLHVTLLSFPVVGILVFTILPLIFMMCMAFTNYSIEDNKLVLFDWVGLDNFKRLINFGGSLGQTFWSVLGWTLVWAFIATFSNYFLGMLLSLLINWKEIRLKKFWRFCFVLTVAVPHFVTLLIIRQMLQPEGAVNILLRNLGLIKDSLPFFTSVGWSRATVIIINMWVGIPYALLQITGILQNIPQELYDAAKVDGANPIMTFRKITLPYMLFVTTPYLITTFMGNVNNFNVIFLTSRGLPREVGMTAGKTDLLITWLYKLTIENQYFDIGAVIGIMTFVTLGIISLLTFHYSGSNRNEEEFR